MSGVNSAHFGSIPGLLRPRPGHFRLKHPRIRLRMIIVERGTMSRSSGIHAWNLTQVLLDVFAGKIATGDAGGEIALEVIVIAQALVSGGIYRTWGLG